MYVDLIVQVVVHKGGPKLVILQPTANSDPGPITHEPMMPTVTCRAQLQNYNGGTVNFQWNLRVQWEGDDGRQFDDSFPGNNTATNSNVSSWTVNWNSRSIG